MVKFCVRIFVYVLCALTITLLGGCFFLFHNQSIDFSRLEHYNPGKPTILLDDAGNEWARFQVDRREPVALKDMPDHLIQAFIASEDRYFFEHNGVSWRGVLRSILVNLYHGRRAQGASTITQQLVRLLFFDAGKTFSRKLKEQCYSLLVEQQFTKQHILQTYLNHIYFGCGIYGVEAASQRFWGKSVRDLAVHESATLAAIICAPNRYCPLLYPLSAQRRRNTILGVMCNLGYISQEEHDASSAVPVTTIEKKRISCAPHLKECIRIKLEKQLGKKELYEGGYVIQTTINSAIQKKAEQLFTNHVHKLRDERGMPFDGGLLSIDVATGDIKAYVGGCDFAVSKFDRVQQAKRQMGSVFKGMVYAASLEQGATFADTQEDEEFELVTDGVSWKPRNYDRLFHGTMTRAYALSRSNNIVTIKTLLSTGVEHVIDVAKRCHLTGPFFPYPSLALGCIDAPLLETVAMFNVFANNGQYVEPQYMVWIKDQWGNKVWKRDLVIPERVMSTRISGQVTKVLGLGVERLKKRFPHSWIHSDAISKTGTTNDSRTCWFMGATPELATGIWIGCDDNRSMGSNTYPVHTAFPIWLDLYRSLTFKKTEFVYDATLQPITINQRTGKPMRNTHDPEAITIFV